MIDNIQYYEPYSSTTRAQKFCAGMRPTTFSNWVKLSDVEHLVEEKNQLLKKVLKIASLSVDKEGFGVKEMQEMYDALQEIKKILKETDT